MQVLFEGSKPEALLAFLREMENNPLRLDVTIGKSGRRSPDVISMRCDNPRILRGAAEGLTTMFSSSGSKLVYKLTIQSRRRPARR